MEKRILSLALAIIVALCMLPISALAENGVRNEVYLHDGDSYNISNAPSNTTIYLTEDGTITLSGQSSKVRVVYQKGKVNLLLADGLNIDPGAQANIGQRTAAITVESCAGGILRLISKEGATARFSSYEGVPAIRKDNTTTHLQFDTENPLKPGTIIASPGKTVENTCAIGAFSDSFGFETNTTGNIYFMNGRVEATGYGGAGIGADPNGSVNGLYFYGGEIIAKAGSAFNHVASAGAGIGTTFGGTVDNIKIYGGTIEARGAGAPGTADTGGGAGIGGGESCEVASVYIYGGDVKAYAGRHGCTAAAIGGGSGGDSLTGKRMGRGNVYIGGGTVYAEGWRNAAAIGGGWCGPATVRIEGGNVTAVNKAFTAIGPGEQANYNEPSSSYISISGGTIHARGGSNDGPYGDDYYDAVAIGAARLTTLDKIEISGGIIYAESYNEPAIGGALSEGRVNNINITGGSIYTVVHKTYHGFPTIGCKNMDTDIRITGGSIVPEQVKNPLNADGTVIRRTPITLDHSGYIPAGSTLSVKELEVTLNTGESYTYGCNDIVVDGDKFDKIYAWIPQYVATVTGAEVEYLPKGSQVPERLHFSGSVLSGESGSLYLATTFYLLYEPGNYGKAAAGYHDRRARIYSLPTAPEGYSITGHYLSEELLRSGSDAARLITSDQVNEASMRILIYDNGELAPNVAFKDVQYTDTHGQWVAQGLSGKEINLQTVMDPIIYNIGFDANPPEATESVSTGTMSDIDRCKYDQQVQLPDCAYALDGYQFVGWNTAPDGSGDAYADGATVSKLASVRGERAILYAQWEPCAYTVDFIDPNTSQHIASVDARYDEPFTLPLIPVDKIPVGKYFLGWSTYAVGSFFADGASVVNLCSATNGGVQGKTLFAIWGADNAFHIAMTNDGSPIDLISPENDIALTGGGMRITGFVQSERGVYSIKRTPPGEYAVSVTGWDASGLTAHIDENGGGTLALDYCTVEVAADAHAQAWIEAGSQVRKIDRHPLWKPLSIGVETDVGYSFESWTAIGIAPLWQDNDPTRAVQSIQVRGKVLIEAHPAANLYSVTFDRNSADAAGAMSDQDMVYDQPQALFANAFKRIGYSFVGWNTAPDGSGAAYADREAVQNLTAKPNAIVRLYAQWAPITYRLRFNGNGADSGNMADAVFTYDKPANLPANAFARANRSFAGWSTSPIGAGTVYEDGASVLNLAAEQDSKITLYAQWDYITYTLVYDPNGGDGTAFANSVWAGGGYVISLNPFTRPGFTFIGWNTQPDGSGHAFEAGEAIIAPMAEAGSIATLYAQWKENPKPPKTGDDSDVGAWLALAITSLGMLIGIIVYDRKYKCASKRSG